MSQLVDSQIMVASKPCRLEADGALGIAIQVPLDIKFNANAIATNNVIVFIWWPTVGVTVQ